jgi:hypothetical protein
VQGLTFDSSGRADLNCRPLAPQATLMGQSPDEYRYLFSPVVPFPPFCSELRHKNVTAPWQLKLRATSPVVGALLAHPAEGEAQSSPGARHVTITSQLAKWEAATKKRNCTTLRDSFRTFSEFSTLDTIANGSRKRFPYSKVAKMWSEGSAIAEIGNTIRCVDRKNKRGIFTTSLVAERGSSSPDERRAPHCMQPQRGRN